MTSVHFRIDGNPYQVSYDVNKDVYLIGHAQVMPDGVLDFSFACYNRKPFMRYLLLRAVDLYRNDKYDKAENMWQAVLEIATVQAEVLPVDLVGKVMQARNDCIEQIDGMHLYEHK